MLVSHEVTDVGTVPTAIFDDSQRHDLPTAPAIRRKRRPAPWTSLPDGGLDEPPLRLHRMRETEARRVLA